MLLTTVGDLKPERFGDTASLVLKSQVREVKSDLHALDCLVTLLNL
jgi:hypothetical protein